MTSEGIEMRMNVCNVCCMKDSSSDFSRPPFYKVLTNRILLIEQNRIGPLNRFSIFPQRVTKLQRHRD